MSRLTKTAISIVLITSLCPFLATAGSYSHSDYKSKVEACAKGSSWGFYVNSKVNKSSNPLKPSKTLLSGFQSRSTCQRARENYKGDYPKFRNPCDEFYMGTEQYTYVPAVNVQGAKGFFGIPPVKRKVYFKTLKQCLSLRNKTFKLRIGSENRTVRPKRPKKVSFPKISRL